MKQTLLSILCLVFLNTFIIAQNQQEIREEQISIAVESMPEFPGGEKKLRKFIEENFKYYKTPTQNNNDPKVHVEFIVDKKGDIYSPKITQSSGLKKVDEEVIRLVKSMPNNWTPGKFEGKPVNTKFYLSFFFKTK